MILQHLKYFLPKLCPVHCLIFRPTKLEEFNKNEAEPALINVVPDIGKKSLKIFFTLLLGISKSFVYICTRLAKRNTAKQSSKDD
jgi:hypothetical protein